MDWVVSVGDSRNTAYASTLCKPVVMPEQFNLIGMSSIAINEKTGWIDVYTLV